MATTFTGLWFCLFFVCVFFGIEFSTFAEKAMATHSKTLAWKILWTEEPGRLHAVHGVAKSGYN